MIAAGIKLVQDFEGLVLHPYLCDAGVWTIGWGTTRYPNGVRVKPSDPHISRKQADEYLHHELVKCEYAVIKYCGVHYLNEQQRAALASFVYNLGAGAFRASTLRKRINSGDWDDVPYQLSRWKFAAGRELAGLVRRRKAEATLWSLGVAERNNIIKKRAV